MNISPRRRRVHFPTLSNIILLFSSLVVGTSGFLSFIPGTKEVGKTIYCDEFSPLDTEYFIPFFESSRTTRGCAAQVPSDSSTPIVHVVKMKTSSKKENSRGKEIVLLTVADNGEYSSKSGMVLILLSNYPVNWRLSIISDNPSFMKANHTIVLSRNSAIVEKNFGVNQLKRIRESTDSVSFKKLNSFVKRYWTKITTYSEIGDAHRVKIAFPENENLPEACNLERSSPNPAVQAYFIEKRETSGCYHAEVAGTSPYDVHLIDLQSANNSTEVSPTSVYLSLNPDRRSKNGADLSRDLVLVLKSPQSVKWLLHSTGLVGNLTVISNGNAVENVSLASSQRLKIIKKKLPNSFNSLWSYITTDMKSTPLSYLKVNMANVLTLVIPPRAKRGLSSIYNKNTGSNSDDETHVKTEMLLGDDRSVIIIPEKFGKSKNLNTSNEYKKLEDLLRNSMSKDCNQRETSVAFPRSLIEELNVTKVTFNDPNCVGLFNETSVVLKSKGTSCASLNYFSNSHPMLKNYAWFYVKGESKPVMRVSFSCRFEAGFPGFSSPSDTSFDDEDYYDDDGYQDDDEEMYELHISRVDLDKKHSEPLAREFGQTAQLMVGDVLKVQTSFETRSFLNLALERCWLSDHPSPDIERLSVESLWLIWNGCPAHSNITAFSTKGGVNPAFAFSITAEHAKMKKIYIFCLLGLCSPVPTNGNMGLCTDPKTSCQDYETHAGPVAQQLTRRGPFFVLGEDGTEAILHIEEEISRISDTREETGEEFRNPSLRSSHVIMVGVPTEVAVAIAIASFVIGAALTGILCCLHHRKSFPKENRRSFHELCAMNARNESQENNGELQSMIPTIPQTNGVAIA